MRTRVTTRVPSFGNSYRHVLASKTPSALHEMQRICSAEGRLRVGCMTASECRADESSGPRESPDTAATARTPSRWVGDVFTIPREQIVHTVGRRNCDVQGINPGFRGQRYFSHELVGKLTTLDVDCQNRQVRKEHGAFGCGNWIASLAFGGDCLGYVQFESLSMVVPPAAREQLICGGTRLELIRDGTHGQESGGRRHLQDAEDLPLDVLPGCPNAIRVRRDPKWFDQQVPLLGRYLTQSAIHMS